MEHTNKDKVSKQLDAQLAELEERFNQFLKELEEDFDFVPAAVKSKEYEDDYYPEFDDRLAKIERKYESVDRKYNLVLALTAVLMFSVLGYLVYVLFYR